MTQTVEIQRLDVNEEQTPRPPAYFNTSRAWVEIDLAALRHNIRVLRSHLSPGTEFWAVIKANAYGHGSVPIATTALAAGAAGLCVATLMEGMELRLAGIQAPVLILGPLNTLEEWQEAHAYHLEMSLTQTGQLDWIRRTGRQRPLPIHLSVDTGMTRLGIPWVDAALTWQHLLTLPEVQCCSLYSHLATAEDPHHPALPLQHQRFQALIAQLQALRIPLPPLHLANSAGTVTSRDLHYDRVRVGLAMYGIAPAPHLGLSGHLRPVMTVKARIGHLQSVPAGTGVSYGHRFITDERTRVATVGIGYADGVPRRLSGWLTGSVRGQRILQVGSVTMDQCMWDVTAAEGIEVGDVVELLGRHGSAQAWAEQLGTIPYEILCGFSSRLPRLVIG